jgi:diadenosine tetraphosphatase ApaH/serine/threonine PP2A family protein phosphatase
VAVVIVADVHANLAALEAVFEHAEAQGSIDAVWSLGDIAGYGPEPRECIALLQRYPSRAVAGNHDLAAIGALSTADFNPAAAQAAEWTATQLTETEREYITGLPETVVEGDFTLVHGSLRDPVWSYLVSSYEAERHLAQQTTPCGLVGHSHLPLVFFADGHGEALYADDRLVLKDERWVANPGSVGQPRDGNPRAAYARLDREAGELTFHRVSYDIGRTQAKMRAAGLPQSLIDRLERGH